MILTYEMKEKEPANTYSTYFNNDVLTNKNSDI